jgi:hypothetical protein
MKMQPLNSHNYSSTHSTPPFTSHQPHTPTYSNPKHPLAPRKQSTNAERNSRINSKDKNKLNGQHVTPYTVLIAQLITAKALDAKPSPTTPHTSNHTRIQSMPTKYKGQRVTPNNLPHIISHNATRQGPTHTGQAYYPSPYRTQTRYVSPSHINIQQRAGWTGCKPHSRRAQNPNKAYHQTHHKKTPEQSPNNTSTRLQRHPPVTHQLFHKNAAPPESLPPILRAPCIMNAHTL